MEKKPLNEGTTRGQVKGGIYKSNPIKNVKPKKPPPPPKAKPKK